MIDVGGYKLEIRCEGQGTPTIVFENGGMPLIDVFTDFKHAAGTEWRVCSHDRAGTGKSESGPSPRNAATIVGELDRLLAAAGERTPIVLVAWSAGAQYALTYATTHPDRVRGVVLIDPRLPAYHLAMPSLIDDPANVELLRKLPPAYLGEFEPWESDARVLSEGAFPDVPLVVLTAGSPETKAFFRLPADDYALWLRTHEDFAASARRGRHVIVDDAEHKIWERNPGTVLDAIRWVIEQQ